MKDKNQNNEDFEVLYDEALSLLSEEGEITTTLLQRKFGIGYEPARQMFDRMLKYGVITEEADFKGKAFDIGDEKSIKVGAKRYDVSNSISQLFLCETDSARREHTVSVIEQLKNKRVDYILFSVEPSKYEKHLDAKQFSLESIDAVLDENDRRYEAIETSCSRNYIDHNSKCEDNKIPLTVIVVDGIDKVIEKAEYSDFIETLRCIAMKSRAAGIHVVALINNFTKSGSKLYEYFSQPINVLRSGFFMKDATNLIMNTFARKGYYPRISISHDESIQISISVEIADHPMFFSYNYDDRALTYALVFPCKKQLDLDTHWEIVGMLDEDKSDCFDSFSDSYYEGHLSLVGSRWDFDVTGMLIENIIDEISRLKVVKKLDEITSGEV